jgi:hypothetical protein
MGLDSGGAAAPAWHRLGEINAAEGAAEPPGRAAKSNRIKPGQTESKRKKTFGDS